MRDILISIFTEYSGQLWSKIKQLTDKQDQKISDLQDNIQDIMQKDSSNISIGTSIDTADTTDIFFKVLE